MANKIKSPKYLYKINTVKVFEGKSELCVVTLIAINDDEAKWLISKNYLRHTFISIASKSRTINYEV